jgi:ABC-type Mn2+/Zn2+ transport system ATPase subunit
MLAQPKTSQPKTTQLNRGKIGAPMSELSKLFQAFRRNRRHHEGAPFLKVTDLCVRYDNLPALENISFELHGGEYIAVVGPNGAGKSTLFKAIAGVLSPTSGRVSLGGSEPGGHICIAYLPQRSDVDWRFPAAIKDVVMMGRVGKMGLFRNPRPEDWEHVLNCLARVNLEGLADRRISELSGGQQQRMFIAQALAQEAELVLMDEPLAGLDVPSQDEFFHVLQGLREQSVTLLVATHDLGMASAHFEKTMLLSNTLLGFGTAAEVFTEDHLKAAYGNHLHIIETESGAMMFEHG